MQKQLVLIYVILKIVLCKKDAPFFGSINSDAKILKSYVNQPGLTNNYRQMLKNSDNYFISEGISNVNIDVSKNILVNGG